MIKLTKINGNEFVLNADLIKFIEETPDTIITLSNGEKVIVKEDTDKVIRGAVEYYRQLKAFSSLDA
ncbi:MAG: flagellar FlbD family protein [Planctomycetota bacterium]|jgi:flagellar protein FlbD